MSTEDTCRELSPAEAEQQRGFNRGVMRRQDDFEARLARLEAAIERAETLFAAFAAGPGKKVLAMLGVKL